MTESDNSKNSDYIEAEELPAYYDALEGLLRKVQINEAIVQKVLDNYKKRPQEFETDAWRMLTFLNALGVRDRAARYVTSQFWSIVKNISLDMLQGIWGGTSLDPYSVGGVAQNPLTASPYSAQTQYPIPPPSTSQSQGDKEMFDLMKMMMMMKMFNQPQTSSTDSMQQMMQMMMMSGGRMGVTQEPVYDRQGNPIIDQATGKQVMRFTMVPSQQDTTSRALDPTLDLFKELIRLQAGAAATEREKAEALAERMRQIDEEMREKETRALRRRLAMIEQENSTDKLLEDINRLKQLGLFPGIGGSQNIDAIKLQTDLERWKIDRETSLAKWREEKEMELRKWAKEQELKTQQDKYTRAQISELGGVLKETINTIGTPVIEAITSGMASAGVQSQPSSQEMPDLSKLSNDELVAQAQQVSQISQKAEFAKQELMEELRRRQNKVITKPDENSIPVKDLDEIELPNDLMLDFSVSSSKQQEDSSEKKSNQITFVPETIEDYDEDEY